MDITITGRNIDLDDALKRYVNRRLGKLENLYRRIYKCEVILGEEKIRKNTEIILYLKRNRVVAKESSTDIYASIDIASDSLKKQLRRLGDRLKNKRRKNVIGRIMRPVARFRGGERESVFPETGRVVKTRGFADKPMLPEEAKLELQIMGKNFMMFKNADTGEANVLYKMGDGNYGLIEPNF